jgi:hypothetical protein
MRGAAIPPLTQYVFISWFLIKQLVRHDVLIKHGLFLYLYHTQTRAHLGGGGERERERRKSEHDVSVL